VPTIAKQIQAIYTTSLVVFALGNIALGLLVYLVNPYIEHTQIWMFYIILWLILSNFGFLVWFWLKKYYFKQLVFIQSILKVFLKSTVYSSFLTMALLLVHLESVNWSTFLIVSTVVGFYSLFQFLD
jgi:hypothetical protein